MGRLTEIFSNTSFYWRQEASCGWSYLAQSDKLHSQYVFTFLGSAALTGVCKSSASKLGSSDQMSVRPVNSVQLPTEDPATFLWIEETCLTLCTTQALQFSLIPKSAKTLRLDPRPRIPNPTTQDILTYHHSSPTPSSPLTIS